MIRLSRLFKRESNPEPDREAGKRGRASVKSSGRNARISTEDPVLTEDPERQRARHRLIGATVLVLVAVIVLPRILDSKPKPVSNDIAVNIVGSLPVSPPIKPLAPSLEVTTAEESRSATPDISSAPPKDAPKLVPQTQSTNSPSVQAKTGPSTTSPVPDKTLGLAAGEEIVVSNGLNAVPSNGAGGTGGKFVIQIGAFASEERAKGWITKLKEQKIPNYVLNRNATDGTRLYALRAGPFIDKDSAEAAEKKIKAMGLTPRIVEVGRQ